MKITKLSPSKHKKGRWLIGLENGELLRVGEQEMISFSLYAGMEMTNDQLEQLRKSASLTGFKEYALNALSTRPMSRHELCQKLEEKGCPPGHALEIVDRLTELGYLDDPSYAAALVRHYAGKGYGPYKIKDELFRRGISREYWDEALSSAETSDEAIDAFITQKLRGVEQPDRKDFKRVSAALARRGYAWSDISAALRRYGADLEE